MDTKFHKFSDRVRVVSLVASFGLYIPMSLEDAGLGVALVRNFLLPLPGGATPRPLALALGGPAAPCPLALLTPPDPCPFGTLALQPGGPRAFQQALPSRPDALASVTNRY